MTGDDMMHDLQFDKEIENFPLEVQFLARQVKKARDEIAEVKTECKKRTETPGSVCTAITPEQCSRVPTSRFTKKEIVIGSGAMVGIAAIVEALGKLFHGG